MTATRTEKTEDLEKLPANGLAEPPIKPMTV
jgi:hypothetical protein